MKRQLPFRAILGALAAAAAVQPGVTAAQEVAGPWRYRATIYGYLPSLSGTTSAPASGGASIEVPVDKILDSLKFTFMGTLDAHNGRWGVFTDVMYLSLGEDKENTRDFSFGPRGGIPAGTTADLEWDFKGLIWTLAGQYRVMSDPNFTVDMLGGARMFRIEQAARWNISGSIGSLPPAVRTGSFAGTETVWDAIVGVKGRYAFGEGQRWSLPFYVDVGTGESKLTWQAAAGVGYGFSWGELTFMWRHLAYEMKAGKFLQEVNFNGPMLGATFTF